MGYEDYQRQIIAAQEQWNREREVNYRTVTQNVGFQGELEKPELDRVETFDHMSLEDMVAGVSRMNPAAVQHGSQRWWNLADTFLSAYGDFARAFQNTVEAPSLGNTPAWGGAAAEAAVAAVRNYADQAGNLFSASWLVSLKLDEMFTGLSETQALMPDVSARPDLAGKTLPKNGVMKAGDFTREEAEQEGHRILNTVYAPVAFQTDHGVPVLPAAPALVSVAGGAGSPAGGSPSARAPEDDARPDAPDLSRDVSRDHEEHVRDEKPGDRTTGASHSGAGQPSAQPSSTVPSPVGTPPIGQMPNAPGIVHTDTPTTHSDSPAPTTAAGVAPSGSPATGSGGDALGAMERPDSPVPHRNPVPFAAPPGRSVPGATPATGAAAVPNTVAGRSVSLGNSGFGPMPGSPSRTEADRTKGVPDYLVTEEHGAELTGLDRPPDAVPPVIGGDDDRAADY